MKFLWGYTKLGRRKIKIYVDPFLSGCYAVTEMFGPRITPEITFAPSGLHRGRLSDTLIHELTHVIEWKEATALRRPDPRQCTQYARAIGRHLPGLLSNLKLGSLDQAIEASRSIRRKTASRARRKPK